ncbi:hypothetical protein FRC17_001882 [Serendipita sp. 399]|nr:hypothetical protein FRC17_001882 [Serendipita sp. 399]
MDNDSYLLLLLSDGNLPTGSFVSSSGLESYLKHGFPVLLPDLVSPQSAPKLSSIQPPQGVQATVTFIEESLAAYARLALPFVSDTHSLVIGHPTATDEELLARLRASDQRYEAMTLNHITRRASKAQGVALLTLFSKGFSRPSWVGSLVRESHSQEQQRIARSKKLEALADSFKMTIRRGETPGHLPICWGILTAALLLSKDLVLIFLKERSQQLFLFLYARSLLSAAIRLNTIGPYAAQQLLLHVIREMVEKEASKCSLLRSGVGEPTRSHRALSTPVQSEEDWARLEADDLPATTWPLGEIIAARHDLQHSRIFNS